MKVGDLVKYKEHPSNGYGVVLQDKEGMFLMFWIDSDPQYNDYVWEHQAHLEVISESR